MTVSQLSLYNGALRKMGERKLASLAENRSPRRVLDDIWNDGPGAIQAMLEKGLWHFAMRVQELTYSPSVTPAFGLTYAFNKTTDWVRTAAVCVDSRFNIPLTQYEDQAGFLFADLQNLYVKFVSNDASYGLNWSLWPAAFIDYFEDYLAWKGALRITQSKEIEAKMEKQMDKSGVLARNLNAMDEPAKFMPEGGWAASRRGNSGRRRPGYNW